MTDRENFYLPAILKENSAGHYIEYYVFNPITKKRHRKTIRMNLIFSRFRTKREAKMYINSIVSQINMKLEKGWNPFFENEDSRLYTNINDAFNIFIQEKEKEMRENTMRSYRSFTSILLQWINDNAPDSYSGVVNHNMIIRFMDYVYNVRNVGQNTYNNYIKMGRAVFNWMVEKCYVKENPFNKIKPNPHCSSNVNES